MVMAGAEASATLAAGQAVHGATDRLRAAGSPSPRLDADLLVAHVLDRDRTWLLAHPETELSAPAAAELDAMVERRAAGVPIAYIRGYKEWLSLRIRTDARALIPRPETELLAEAAIGEVAGRLANDASEVTVWEVATGSGAVAIALATRFRTSLALGRARLIASDSSPDAVELAAENLAAHGVADHVTIACVDLLASAGTSLPRPDVVVANLPYLTSDEVDRGEGSIAHEPRLALDGGPDGLDLVRRLVEQIGAGSVAPRATVLLEVGAGQAAAVAGLAPSALVSTLPDLAGIERVVRIALP